ncbi:MAG: shikimate kinase [Cyclobacteriaceae bacterium]
MNNIIYLLGLPGSGKSTLGKEIAERLGYGFVDVDHEIELQEGKLIKAIFSEEGETYFREVESTVLQSLLPESNTIIATGGGAPCFFDNMDFMMAHGTTIFLDISVKELMYRMEASDGQEDRPLLTGKGKKELEKELALKREQRGEFYEQADISIQDDNINAEIIIQLINS